MIGGVTIVAEVKTKSPFGFASGKSWEEQFKLANQIGDIVSIHTDSRWGGSMELVKMARRLTSKPILAKGIHETDKMVDDAVKAGADYVLVVGRLPEIRKEICWIEPLTTGELRTIPESYKVVWNTRDLRTGKPKAETFEQARGSWHGWLCQASYIKDMKDVKEGADGILVGEGLGQFALGYNERLRNPSNPRLFVTEDERWRGIARIRIENLVWELRKTSRNLHSSVKDLFIA